MRRDGFGEGIDSWLRALFLWARMVEGDPLHVHVWDGSCAV